ncbi:hypothetical protein F5Y16DRAFT_382890 [Xylariaceae sp. FL0255]|nr:hypothetical protein F5Y16DRAFT_382890 [Xylariaceae sp. FL0255]
MLRLHSPYVADGWNLFLRAVRTCTSLPPGIRELVISHVAVCNGVWYEWDSHAPLGVAAGVSPAVTDFVREGGL